jgi:hypothetical protein
MLCRSTCPPRDCLGLIPYSIAPRKSVCRTASIRSVLRELTFRFSVPWRFKMRHQFSLALAAVFATLPLGSAVTQVAEGAR